MNGTERTKRIVSAHRLPIALEAPHTRDDHASCGPEAPFVAQLLATRDSARMAFAYRRVGSEASHAYRRTESSDVKRMPAGYRKTMSA